MSVASRIQQAREAKGMKQVDLANMVGVQPGAIWNYENGKSSPKEPIVFRLMSALGVDANYLYQDEMREACAKIVPSELRAWAAPLIDAYERASDAGAGCPTWPRRSQRSESCRQTPAAAW